MTNKKLGTEFEKEAVEWFAKNGWWVHFLSPDASGAQPFDLIAVKGCHARAMDCKTTSRKMFGLDRLEDNQVMAFDKWIACGNYGPILLVKYKNCVYGVPYLHLKYIEPTVDITEHGEWILWSSSSEAK